MATSSKDGDVKIWDLEKRREVVSIHLGDEVNGVAVSGSGYLLSLIEGNSKVKLYQLEDIYSSADGSLEPHPLYKNQYAVVVGIDRYRRLSIPKLSSGVEDAKGVARVLKDRGFKVIELYNESATRDTILDALKRVKLLAKSGDATLFYFAGHGEGVSGYNGVREGYILPYDFIQI